MVVFMSHCLQIFRDGKLNHFVDGSGSHGNWMAKVKCARFAHEQNLAAVQVKDTMTLL